MTVSTARERLLESAGEVFAERGFRATTVREIVRRAGANIASVNYHFRDKQSLYVEVLKYCHGAAEEIRADGGVSEDAPADQQLRGFIRGFLQRLLREGRPAWHGRLMAREMAEPTEGLDEMVKGVIKPIFGRLLAILQALLPGASKEQLRMCGRSIISQCVFYKHAENVLSRMEGGMPRTAMDIEVLAVHIADFSLDGIRGLKKK